MSSEPGREIAALRAFGIQPLRIEPAKTGWVNRHWFVESGEGQAVLREYRRDRSRAAIEWEHSLLAHARARGWPVAPAIACPAGPTIVTVDETLFSLFPLLPGEPAVHPGLGQKHVAGRLLARLHADLRDFNAPGQRDGFGRAWELDLFVRAAGAESFNVLLESFGHQHPELASGLRREKYRNLRELARLGYGDLPGSPVHCDFGQEHLLFQGPELSGVLDFDLARLDAPVYDIAASLLAECTEAPDHDAISIPAAQAFIEGYAGFRRLGEQEARLLVPLTRAVFLWLSMFRLLQWRDGDRDKGVRSIKRTVERRFPALLQRAAELERVALAASD